MCGINGFWQYQPSFPMQSTIDAMTELLAHRGPNARGVWCDEQMGVALGHRRLAIRDLSSAGAQPMVSQSGRFVIVYNGETYSEQELLPHLKQHGIHLKGHSDTELILESIEALGLEFTLSHLIGMFAFALWDNQEKTLTLVRDRYGIKPLYYGEQNNVFAFASELSALKAIPNHQHTVSPEALSRYLHYGYVPAPLSIYENIYKLPPASLLVIERGKAPRIQSYWDFKKIVASPRLDLSYEEAIHRTHALLEDAVERRMIADVPIGAFLSGGIDSSLVAALMQLKSSQPIQTFTIGFNEAAFDETPFAKQVAQHLGAKHHEFYLGMREASDMVPHMASIYDEPFADSSQIPTTLISRIASQHLKVILTGDGGDEQFAGYTRYIKAPTYMRLKRFQNRLPWMHYLQKAAQQLHDQTFKTSFNGRRFDLCVKWFKARDEWAIYDQFMQHSRHDVLDEQYRRDFLLQRHDFHLSHDFELLQAQDAMSYLPDDILVKVDRASMHYGLETRVPLLDHRITEWVWQLPAEYKLQHKNGKRILKDILAKHLPRHLFERPKMGFGVPLAHWLREECRAWAEELLQSEKLTPYFNASHVHRLWRSFLRDEIGAQQIWPILMFQSWRLNY